VTRILLPILLGLSLMRGALPAAESAATGAGPGRSRLLVVLGAPGEEAYQTLFKEWGDRWLDAAKKAELSAVPIGFDPATATNSIQHLRDALNSEPKEGWGDLWIVLIGHGTFNGKEAKFNLTGYDVTAQELAEWLKPFRRRLAVINCTSASGPFLKALSGEGRSILTATKNGAEQNYARYGDFISAAIADPEADLDKDGQTSLLEAHLTAAKRTADFYQLEQRMATEHPLLDDNGDGLGTPADWFRGVRAVKKAKDGAEPDGLRANQLCLVPNLTERALPPALRQQRDQIELKIARLRETKATMSEDDYYSSLEPLLLDLARLYASSTKP
jgi:hypothetical protein